MTTPWGSWPPQIPPTSGGGGSGTATELATTGLPVDVSGADPPVAGQVLTALDAETAVWRVPGLHYDPAIRFNVDASGTATIEPGTWGFVQTVPSGFEGEVQIFVVSSLTAPPVDSRFGLYVAPTLATTVEVHLIGASQIMGLDGVLGTSCVLYPGAMYEWVFYHEGGVAIWGMVSDTARMAQRLQAPWLAVSDPNNAVFPITLESSEPPNGATIVYRNVGAKPTAAWELPEFVSGSAGDAQHGIRDGGTMHSVATTAIAGFMSAADKTKIDGVATGAAALTSAAPSNVAITAAVGVATTAARADHVHALVTSYKEPVRLVSSTNIASLSGLIVVDTTTVVSGDRVLLVGQTTTSQNGIWVAAVSAWSRATDADGVGDLVAGMAVVVTEGGSNSRTSWLLTTTGVITPGTTGLSFTQWAGTKSAGTPTAIQFTSTSGGPGGSNQWSPIDHQHKFPAADLTLNNFRISNNASSIPTDTTASTVTLAQHNGNRISLYNGTDWFSVPIPGAAPSVAVTGQTAGVPCDVFAVFSTTTTCTLELVAWTNASTRATALAQFEGVWVKSGTQTRRYLGTILPDSATTFSHVSAASNTTSPICGLWNQDNRIRGAFSWTPTFDTWAIPSASSWQSINGQASAKVQYVQGQSIDLVSAVHIGAASGSSGGSIGIGLDSTTAATGFRDYAANNGAGALRAELRQLVAAGAHNLNAIANAAATSVTYYGSHAPMLGGISADLWY